MSTHTIATSFEQISHQIAVSATRSLRNPQEIQLIAVSKTQPPDAIQQLLETGHSLFGESRVQEALAKIPLIASNAKWHFIGHLQKNKIRQALPIFECLESVDSLELAVNIDRIARELGLFPRVLLEINIATESSKHGFHPDHLRAEMESLLALERLQIEGFMGIPPRAKTAEDSRRYFAKLREIRDATSAEFRVPLPQLSMGMSGDFPVAIEEGATMVRVGTALFGERAGKTWKPAADAGD